MESHEIDIASEKVTGKSEKSFFAQAVRHVVYYLFMNNKQIKI